MVRMGDITHLEERIARVHSQHESTKIEWSNRIAELMVAMAEEQKEYAVKQLRNGIAIGAVCGLLAGACLSYLISGFV